MGKTFIKSPMSGKLVSGKTFKFREGNSNEDALITANIITNSSLPIFAVDKRESTIRTFSSNIITTLPKDTVLIAAAPSFLSMNGGIQKYGLIGSGSNIYYIYLASGDFSVDRINSESGGGGYEPGAPM